ncbi:hypothetical protein A4X06_0g8235 [Tilletia controversa]|uniref:Uncharacterized protein n=2 Tax=Tilletia TaxID=13289 RepID=A0A8X7ML93_9BASI|nr:hypothetical protein CF336_g7529 [Tilletia laevis]KAE8185331.1 hypothetical protein CF328_g7579 [Tilletia controversa]KAE8239491.1 hypothetical protein A4X06_0g8235 [Tilletia controversa]KAE8243859.1 hypothetical protein A4X03_0g7659 [Tilletia caries]
MTRAQRTAAAARAHALTMVRAITAAAAHSAEQWPETVRRRWFGHIREDALLAGAFIALLADALFLTTVAPQVLSSISSSPPPHLSSSPPPDRSLPPPQDLCSPPRHRSTLNTLLEHVKNSPVLKDGSYNRTSALSG